MATRNWLGLSALVLLAGGCQVLALQWVTPAAAAVGSLFTVECTVTTDGNLGSVGAVLQVPNGFTVLGASAYTTAPSVSEVAAIVRDDAQLLAVYAPDPGHYLASSAGRCCSRRRNRSPAG